MDLTHRLARIRLGRRAVRDPSRMAVAAAGAAAVLVCAAAGGVVWWSLGQLGDEVEARDLDTAAALADALGRLPGDERAAALPAPSPRRAFALIAEDGSASPPDLGTSQDGARWQRWAARVVREAGLAQQFTTRDPSGAEWRYVTAAMPDGSTVLLGRPGGLQPAVIGDALRAVFAVLLGVGLLGAIAWPLVRRGFLRPLDGLIETSEDLRWRGEVRPVDRRQLERLGRRSDHVGRLARSLTGVDQDIGRSFLQLSTLLETIRAVAGSLDTSEVFERILHQIRLLFGVERCAVLSLDERGKVFVVRASLGLSDPFVRELQVDPAEPNSPSMRALRSGTPVQVSDADSDLSYADFRQRAQREGYRCVLAIPLATSMAPPAVLLLYKSEPYRYSHSELELASSFAGFASIAMENAALYVRIDERLQEQTRRLEAIIESLDDGLILAGSDGMVSYCNVAAGAMVDADHRQLTGARVDELLRRLGAEPSQQGDRAGETESVEVSATVAGQRRDLRLRSFSVTDEHGAVLGRGHLWQDITSERVIDRLKTSLLTTASHELRAPLANIKGYVSTLLADDVSWGADEQREFLATISAETDRLIALVRSLLDMSRIEAGMLAIRRKPVPVRDLVERAAAGLPPDARQRLRLHVPDGIGVADVDRSRVETAIRNLVDNALKFSPPAEPVDVTADGSDNELRISVRDRGAGVPEHLRERIFESFVRGDDSLTREAGGFGLGLAISRGFIEAHGGRVWSRPEDPGTSFVLALPVGEGKAG